MTYSKSLIIQFVKEWKAAPPGPESFGYVCSRYPDEFKTAWRSIQEKQQLDTWEEFEEAMIHELCVSRTKLGRALR